MTRTAMIRAYQAGDPALGVGIAAVSGLVRRFRGRKPPPALFSAPQPSLFQRALSVLPQISPAQARRIGLTVAGTAGAAATGLGLGPALLRGGAALLPRIAAAAAGAPTLAAGVPRGAPIGWGLPRRRRGRGITATELRGARKVARLVAMYGMRPKVLARRRKA